MGAFGTKNFLGKIVFEHSLLNWHNQIILTDQNENIVIFWLKFHVSMRNSLIIVMNFVLSDLQCDVNVNRSEQTKFCFCSLRRVLQSAVTSAMAVHCHNLNVFSVIDLMYNCFYCPWKHHCEQFVHLMNLFQFLYGECVLLKVVSLA